MARIPPATKDALDAAMDRFDAEFRGKGRWERWPTKADKFAIGRAGKRYPVKFVIHLATGIGVDQFSGGVPANSYVTKRGLTVIEL